MLSIIVSTLITAIVSALAGGAFTYLAAVKKFGRRVSDLEKWRGFVQEDVSDSCNERKLIIQSLLACLRGLEEQGCNGPVKGGIAQIETYLLNCSHEAKSYTKNT